MAEDEAIFDPTMKKKKKKKKTPLEFEIGLEGGDAAVPEEIIHQDMAPKEIPPTEEIVEEVPSKVDLDTDDLDLDNFSKTKKKKKKKIRFDMDTLLDTLPVPDAAKEGSTQEVIDTTPVQNNDVVEIDVDADTDTFSSSMKKKKKKKRVTIETSLENGQVEKTKDEGTEIEAQIKAGVPWAGSERDYTYEELLKRVFDIMRAKNPDMVGDKKRFVMKPPQVVRVGTKKSSFVNFSDICRMLHRQPEHLLAFLLAELGTSGSIDGQNMLIIKGRFQQKQIENVLRRYIKEYVTCHTCRSSDTILHKENRLFFLQCESCQSRCSVASIKSGFQAVTSKRATIRAKAN